MTYDKEVFKLHFTVLSNYKKEYQISGIYSIFDKKIECLISMLKI
ncbi:hypothetical protein HMPREF0765_1727 [Sphingobacterium spiritivorum ATCC 33300]|uniref:Uncharacterized protein n=1 Tax=Sphingobacterium spiritivorum ATCC 33300 TaxID=525372 RepID=C2FWM1_SPHSI|nr:hypothetical protein HMPREF0765_1727 [Sphingobacterium spiritivorum ATCC 33300]